MADRKITDLTALAAGDQATGDFLTIVDVSEAAAVDKNKKITVESLFKGIPSNVGIGTASPLALYRSLSIHGPANDEGGVLDLATANQSSRAYVFNDSNGLSLQTATSHPILLKTNNSERLRIDSSGNLGLGTSAPVGKAYISGPNVSTFGVAADAALNLAAANGALVNRVVNLNFACVDSATNAVAAVGMKYTSQSGFGKGDLIFGTRSVTTDTAPTERMRIDSSGRVGIGIAPSSSPLEVLSGTSNSSLIEASGASAGRGLKISTYANTANDAGVLIEAPYSTYGQLAFGTAGSERMRIDSSGHLNLVSGSSTLTNLNFTENQLNTYARIEGGKSGSGVGDLRFHTYSGGLSERMRIDSSGNVGIANTTPSSYNAVANDLVVGNHSGAHGITIAAQNNNTGYLNWADGTGSGENNAGRIAYSHADNSMRFDISASERMRIDSSGRLLVGTTTPGLVDADNLTIATNGGTGVTIRSGTSSDGNIYFADGTSGTDRYKGIVRYQHLDDALLLYTNATERMRIDSSGKVRIGMSNYGADVSASNAGTQILNENTGHFNTGAAATTTVNHHLFFNPNGLVGSIQTSGSSTAFNTSSDYRLKENVVDIADGITRVKQLSPRRFNFIADDTTTVDGFIAHEAQVVVPEAVNGTHDEVDADGNAVMQGIDQSKLVPLLTAALQEAIAKIETLEAKVAALEAG